MLNILIVDDNYNYLESLFNELNIQLSQKLRIIAICNDGEKALNYIMNNRIDIILLDLNIPKLNGIEILEKMQKNNIKNYVIAMSGDSDFIVELIKKNLKGYKTFVKPFKLENLISILNEIVYAETQNIDYTKIINLLNNFNFNKNSIGYTYIIDCLNYCIEKKITFITHINELYNQISNKYSNISYSNISWDIAKAIQVMNKSTDDKIFDKYFSYSKYPSPKTFLNGILNIYYSK